MKQKPRLALALCGILGAGAVGLLAAEWPAIAADHLDPPARTDPAVDSSPDKAADIADIYVWHTAENLVMALTFAGPQATDLPATYDRDVLYTINISNAGRRPTRRSRSASASARTEPSPASK